MPPCLSTCCLFFFTQVLVFDTNDFFHTLTYHDSRLHRQELLHSDTQRAPTFHEKPLFTTMVYPSPPRTATKETKYGLFKTVKTPKAVYYEDVYGTRSSDDDEPQGVVDLCESESDSDDEEAFSKSPEYQRQFGRRPKKAVEEQRSVPGVGSAIAGMVPEME